MEREHQLHSQQDTTNAAQSGNSSNHRPTMSAQQNHHHSSTSSSFRNTRRHPIGTGNHNNNHKRKNHHSSSPFVSHGYSAHQEDDTVDDLAVAAQYAFAVPVPTFLPPPPIVDAIQDNFVEDDNEIDLDSSSSKSLPVETIHNCGSDDVVFNHVDTTNFTQMNPSDVKGSESDDDVNDTESDIDLMEQLEQMVGEGVEDDDDDDDDDDDINNKNPTVRLKNKPMTVNEIDAYQADLHQLQDILQWNVSIGTEQHATSTTTVAPPLPTSHGRNQSQEWRVAGHIQHHMMEERTIVILSVLGGVLLKEGTTLALQSKDVSTTTANCFLAEHDTPDLIPIGKILEIFGPVSQPLYSVRMPFPTQPETIQQLTKTVDGEKAASDTSSNRMNMTKELHSTENTDDSVQLNSKPIISSTVESKVVSNDAADSNEIQDVTIERIEPSIPDTMNEPTLPVDHWNKNGDYTKLLRACLKLPVYFWYDPTATNVLDTEAVYRNSGRGCDASNIFDEEIIEVQDYSDDEQERVAKGNHKKKNHSGGAASIHSGNIPTKHGDHDRQHRTVARTHISSAQSYQSRIAGHERQHGTTTGAHTAAAQSYQSMTASVHTVLPPHGFHPQAPQTMTDPQGRHVGGPAYYSPYPTTFYPSHNPPGTVLNAPQYTPTNGFYTQQHHPQQYCYYNGAYHNAPPPPPPPPPPNTAQQPPSQGNSTDIVYYDFS
jgi:rRNA processing protein Gar1